MNKHNNCLFKFRVWSKKYQMFTHNPMWPSNQRTSEIFVIDEGGEIRELVTVDGENYFWDLTNHKKDDLIIQRYTGLKDKNGKEIYEGDIVKDLDNEFGVVEYNHGAFIVNVNNQIVPFWSVLAMNNIVQTRQLNPSSFEIIGNIFENLELIK